MQVNYSNGQIFIKFEDGSIVLQACSREQASQIMMLEDKDEVLKVLNPQLEVQLQAVEEAHKKNAFWNNFNDDRFYLNGDKLYHRDIPLSIPKVLADTIQALIIEGNEEELSKLEKFWMWCSLIRSAESRESFFSYIKNNNLLITDQGLVIGFRRAYFKGENVDLVKFVTQTYLKKRTSKKSTDITVWGCNNESGAYTLSPDSPVGYYEVGNLKDMYHSFQSERGSYFESWHKNTFTNQPEKYFIGKETKLPLNQCNLNPNVSCGAGLHFGGASYSMSGFGDTPIAFVFNPMTLLACPNSYDTGRCQAQTFLCALNNDREFELTKETSTIVDEIYGDSIQYLQDELAKGKFEEWKEGHTILAEIPEVDVSVVLQKVLTNVSVKDRLIKL